ncbi:MAG: lysozyme [Cytophagales bacterium]|nr:lysozyme [Cytophagales bacterium]
MIKDAEGCRLEVYKCPANKSTIGFGHLLREGEKLDRVTLAQAEELLKKDIKRVAIKPLKGLIEKGSLTQNQYDAVVSLVFNVGPGDKNTKELDFATSKTLRLIQNFAKNKASMTQEQLVQFEIDLRREWSEFCKGGDKVLPGLIKRRQKELDLFFGHPAPSKKDK